MLDTGMIEQCWISNLVCCSCQCYQGCAGCWISYCGWVYICGNMRWAVMDQIRHSCRVLLFSQSSTNSPSRSKASDHRLSPIVVNQCFFYNESAIFMNSSICSKQTRSSWPKLRILNELWLSWLLHLFWLMYSPDVKEDPKIESGCLYKTPAW